MTWVKDYVQLGCSINWERIFEPALRPGDPTPPEPDDAPQKWRVTIRRSNGSIVDSWITVETPPEEAADGEGSGETA